MPEPTSARRDQSGSVRHGPADTPSDPPPSETGPPSTGNADPDPADPDPADAEPDDAELLRQHVAGDPDAFGVLFLRHRDRLWAVAIRTLSDPEDAADALQDAMISAFRRADSFRGDSAVTTWLHRIVVNACLDRMRRRAARPSISGGDERMLDAIAASGSGSDPSSDSDVSLDVMAALGRLPHDQQVVLVLVDMLGYPVADVAEMLGISAGTVKSRCARGRARLLPRLAYLRQPDGPVQPEGSARSAFPGAAGELGRGTRNQSAPGAVLPAREGGDETP